MRKLSRPAAFILGCCLVALLWHAFFLPFSRGAYTDGLLQVAAFRYGLTYWPPLYGMLVRPLAWLPGIDLELAGRLVSMLAGALVVWPIGAIARRLFGLRAALWAMAAWIASPMALRWSVQVMTDMPMTALWTGALAGLLLAVEAHLPGMFPAAAVPPAPDPRRGEQWLLLATAAAVLSTLTRYQGVLLLPLTLLAAWRLATPGSRAGYRWGSQALWLAVPLWTLRGGLGALANHFEQIGARSGGEGLLHAVVQVYWNTFEAFLLLSPYFVTYGIFGFCLYGMLRTNWATARLRWAGWATLYLTLAVLALQAVFTSFQSRYLLPLLPLVCLFAGHGLGTWERHCAKHWGRFWLLAGPTLGFALAFAAMVGVFQGNPFLDIKQAARYVANEMELPDDSRILTNEVYNTKIGAVKVDFWSGGGHPVLQLSETRPQPNDVIVLSSFYAGDPMAFLSELDRLSANPAIDQVALFKYRTYPLLPDLMGYAYRLQPNLLNQNPMAWHFRYLPQDYETAVLRVRDVIGEWLESTPPPRPRVQPSDNATDALREQLRTLQNEMDVLEGIQRQVTPDAQP